MTAIEIVRQHVGRRPRITREEMTAILFSLPTDLVAASTIVGRAQDGETYYIDRQWVAPMEARAATAHAWAAACRRINCISVMRGSYYPNSDVEVAPVDGLIVRYDLAGDDAPAPSRRDPVCAGHRGGAEGDDRLSSPARRPRADRARGQRGRGRLIASSEGC